MTETFDRFDYVLTMLANRLKKSEDGVVFLLGAGCSCQYGLPTFKQLLTYIWEDCYGESPVDSRMEALRESLDKHWHALGPKGRRDILHRSLRRVDGRHCPGYRRLARLCHPKSFLNIRAIVNMNFDSLLEDALTAEGVPYRVVAGFAEFRNGEKGELIICKPHGSLGPVRAKKSGRWVPIPSDLILDIANSEMFARIEEQTAAQELLASHDVVALGYSGVDSKIAASLRNMPENSRKSERFVAKLGNSEKDIDPRDKKLFFVNSSLPDSRLFLVMTERASQNLSITGEEAAFENFMEQLDSRVSGKPHSPDTDQVLYRPIEKFDHFTFMTRSERAALYKCLRLALRIRAAINVADRSEVSIEEHGTSVYRSCLQLAEASGVCLSPPEKYVLYAVAFLHDLGYFAAYSDGTAIDNGWQLLDGEHGKRTADLLELWLLDRDEKPDIVPVTYDSPKEVISIIKFVCQFHPSYDNDYIDNAIKSRGCSDPRNISEIKIGGCEVPVRVVLLQALFAAAEELAKAHPWEPSADTLLPKEEENRWAIEDPVLDLYLRKKRNVVSFRIERGRVIGSAQPAESKKADWLLAIVDEHIKYYEKARMEVCVKEDRDGSKKRKEAKRSTREEGTRQEEERHKEWQIVFIREPEVKVPESDEKGSALFAMLLRDALEEELEISLREVRCDFARDLDILRRNGEAILGKLCLDLANMGLGESVMILRMIQRALTLLCLPDLWYSEIVRHLEQARQDIDTVKLDDPESIVGIASKLLYACQPLLMTLEPDNRLFLVERSDSSWLVREASESNGGEALGKIRHKLGWSELSVLHLLSYHKSDEAAFLKGEIEAVLELLGNNKNGIMEVLGTGTRSLLLGASAVVDSVCSMDSVHSSESSKDELLVLSEKLSSLASNLGVYFSGELASVLDLISIYALSVHVDPKSRRRIEPRVSLAKSKVVADALEAIGTASASQFFPHQGLLHIYLPLRRRRDEGKVGSRPAAMDNLLLKSFDEIIYPAWRFFAKSWHYGIEPVLMARICLDLGSSRFRSEVVNGLKFLMKRVEPKGTAGEYLCGHDGCTLCTSRLLYIFSYGCKLFPRDELEKIRVEGRSFDKTVGSLLNFMIARDEEEPDLSKIRAPRWRKGRSPKWKGSEKSAERPETIQSSDYLAWAPRAIAFCLSVDEEMRNKTGISWLEDKCGVDLEKCNELLNNRFNHLFEEKSEDLLSRHGEEPHSFILGHIALTMLDLETLSKSSKRVRAVNDRVPQDFKESFREAYLRLEDFGSRVNSSVGAPGVRGGPALLSRLYSWPAGILYGKYLEPEDHERVENSMRMVKLCRECVRSEIWIREGSDAGSWGYNIKNSQTIITSLSTFWRHAFDKENKEMYGNLFEQEEKGDPL